MELEKPNKLSELNKTQSRIDNSVKVKDSKVRNQKIKDIFNNKIKLIKNIILFLIITAILSYGTLVFYIIVSHNSDIRAEAIYDSLE